MTGQAMGVCADRRCDDQCLTWSPDGQYLAAGGYRVGLVYYATDYTCIVHHSAGGGGPTAVAWSPNGCHLAWASGLGHIYIRDVASGRLVWRAKPHGRGIPDLAYFPARRLLSSSG